MKKEKLDLNYDKRKFFSLNEAVIIFGIPADTLRKWIKRDGSDGIPALPAFRPGKEILIQKEALENYIKRFPIPA
jgi:hypothetical protein